MRVKWQAAKTAACFLFDCFGSYPCDIVCGMDFEAKLMYNGTVTTPQGFKAGAVASGIKNGRQLDLGILYSEAPCAAAATFTTNKVKAAPVILSQHNLAGGRARAVVVNAGCANACTGERGAADAAEMASIAADKLGIAAGDMVVASTGVIGVDLPMESVRSGLENMELTRNGGHDLARAIMTTDSRVKEVAVDIGGVKIGGIAKGAGMIHPNMATMLSFVTTDADVERSIGAMLRVADQVG